MLSKDIQKQIETYLEEKWIQYKKQLRERNDAVAIYCFDMECGHGHYDTAIVVDNYIVHSIAYFPLEINPDMRHEVCEFISRVNYSYCENAKFEMNFDDGTLRVIWDYETFWLNDLEKEFIGKLITAPGLLMERFWADLTEMIEHSVPAKAQYDKVKMRISEMDDTKRLEKGFSATFIIEPEED